MKKTTPPLCFRRLFAAAAAAFAAAGWTAGAHAVEPVPWQVEQFRYSTAGASVPEALRELAAQGHVQIAIAPGLHGDVAGRFNMPPQKFLELLGASYGVSWYYDGQVLRVSPAVDRHTLAIRLNYATTDALLSMLDATNVTDPRYPAEVDEGADTVVVSGPPDYLARVDQAARSLDHAAREKVDTEVRVVRLRVARAADRSEIVADRAIVQPGVATRLRERLAAMRTQPAEPTVKPVEYERPLPIIEADPQTNSVLVRDRAEKVDADAEMIRAMDQQPELVKIAAYVADVDDDALDTLALDWQPIGGSGPDAYAVPGTGPAPRYAYTDDNGAGLVVKLKRLAAEGRAQMEMERSMVTADGSSTTLNSYRIGPPIAGDADVPMGVPLDVTPVFGGTVDEPRVALTAQFARPGKSGAAGDLVGAPLAANVDVAPGRCVVIAASPLDGKWPLDGETTTISKAGRVPRTRVVLLIPTAHPT